MVIFKSDYTCHQNTRSVGFNLNKSQKPPD